MHATRVLFAVLFLGLFAMAARTVADPDLWWHLKTGQIIVEQKTVPHTDPFSFTRAGQPWVAHEWLTEVVLYELQRLAGWGGLIVAFALVICAAFFLLYVRCGNSAYVAGVATLFAAFAMRPVWGVRPQMLSFLLTSLWLWILERSERNPKVLWWTLPLTLLWVNLHAGFALGLALSALFIIGEWMENKFHPAPNHPHLGFSAFILALDLLVVPLNPNGMKLLWYPIGTLQSAAMQNYIAEWASPNFHSPEYWPFLFLVLVTFAALSRTGLRLRFRDLLLLAVSLFASLRSIRFIPFFVLISVPLISNSIATWLRSRPLERTTGRSPRRTVSPAIRSSFNASIVAAMAVFALLHTTLVIDRQPHTEMEHFPVGAVEFLQSHPPRGRIFNHYDWGGYLIWSVYPSTRVFIDGRADLYGDHLLHQFAETYQFKDDWRRTLALWNIQTVLIPVNSALATGLRHAPGWTISYEDALAIVLTANRGSEEKRPNAALTIASGPGF